MFSNYNFNDDLPFDLPPERSEHFNCRSNSDAAEAAMYAMMASDIEFFIEVMYGNALKVSFMPIGRGKRYAFDKAKVIVKIATKLNKKLEMFKGINRESNYSKDNVKHYGFELKTFKGVIREHN